MTVIWWLRRDLRLEDNPALTAAAAEGTVLPLFVRDPSLSGTGLVRRARLEASLAALDESTGGALVVRSGDPRQVLPTVAREAGATGVRVTGEFTPFALRRDRVVAQRLEQHGVALHAEATPYAVRPGTLRTGTGTPYRVFTPFARAWRAVEVPPPDEPATAPQWCRRLEGEPLDPALLEVADRFGSVGEHAAHQRWRSFLDDGLAGYGERRDRPDLPGSSRLSASLRHGEIHPRTLLRDIARHPGGNSAGAAVFITELAWREFYADVVWHRPDSVWNDLRGQPGMEFDDGPAQADLVQAWREGRTGYPFVDAGMRQLLETGWMHNRLRMITASFLVKDLHVPWQVGARHFLDQLVDGDVASNNHGWQWVAGTGTDASPYFRVFNPVVQGKRFDPHGDYVRTWIPELAHLPGPAAHEPWRHPYGAESGYGPRVVDHDLERREALARYDRVRASVRERSV